MEFLFQGGSDFFEVGSHFRFTLQESGQFFARAHVAFRETDLLVSKILSGEIKVFTLSSPERNLSTAYRSQISKDVKMNADFEPTFGKLHVWA